MSKYEAKCICWIAGYCDWWNPPEEMRLIKNDFCIKCREFMKG